MTAPRTKTCPRCGGKSGYWARIPNECLDSRCGHSCSETHYVDCDQPGCNHGTVDLDEYYRIVLGDSNEPTK